MNNSTASGEISDAPMIGVPSNTESEESGSGEGSKNRDVLYLFTRDQVFKKSSRWSSAPTRSLSFPMHSPNVMKLPTWSFTTCSDQDSIPPA